MRNFVKFVMISFLAAVAVGCGSSEDFVFTNNNNGPANQGFQILLSQAELAAMFPPVNPQTIDPSIVKFEIFVLDANGNVAFSTERPNTQTDINIIAAGLLVASYDVVVQGVDANGDIVRAYTAKDILVIANDIREIGAALFSESDGYTPPDDDNGGGGEGKPIQGGTVNNLEFQYSGDYNGTQDPVSVSSQISGAMGEGENGEQSLTITLSDTVVGPPVSINLLTVTIVDRSGADLVPNQPYEVLVNDVDPGSVATLTETGDKKSWVSEGLTSTGTATITQLTDTQVTVEFDFDNLIVNSEFEDNAAQGSFDLIGSITGNFVVTP